jgi:glycosyltransferase involved in cell wall biosynthesis
MIQARKRSPDPRRSRCESIPEDGLVPNEESVLHHEHVRLYDQVRTAHLERARVLEPAAIVYHSTRYDFDPALAEGLELVQAGPLRAFWMFLRSPVTVLEINEPLYLPGLPSTALALLASDLRAVVTHSRPLVVTYAIEDLSPFSSRPPRLRTRLRRRVERMLARGVWARCDRVVFGTSAALELYRTALGAPRHADTSLIPALPSPCDCAESIAARDPLHVLFLGAFTERKGFDRLLEAWPLVRDARPGSRLSLVGQGPMLADALAATAADDSIAVVTDPPRAFIHSMLRTVHVLVLPSVRLPRWREQIGLPILEGLAHGCEVVTTTETGIADWLSDNGHRTLDSDWTPADLAGAIVEAIDASRDPEAVLADLPIVDGRIEADRWLFRVVTKYDSAATDAGARSAPVGPEALL